MKLKPILLLILVLLLVGCGGGSDGGGGATSSSTSTGSVNPSVPSNPTNPVATTAGMRLDLQFDPTLTRTQVLDRLPSASSTIVIQVFNADTGVLETTLPTVSRTGDVDQIVSASGLNPGHKRIHVIVLDSSGQQLGHQDIDITLVAGQTANIVVDNLVPDVSPSPSPAAAGSPSPGGLPVPSPSPVASPQPSPGSTPGGSPQPSPAGPTISALFIKPSDPQVSVAATAALTVTAVLPDGTTQDVTSQAVWLSTDATIATFIQPGLVSGVAVGLVPIKASFGGLTATVNLQVLPGAGGGGGFNPPPSTPAPTPTPSLVGLKWTGVLNSVSLNGIVNGGGQFVAVGRMGIILSSSDAVHWVTRIAPDPTSTDLRGVAFGNGQYVAVGGNVILSSPDGITWTSQKSHLGAGAQLNAVAFGGGQFVAAGNAGAVTTSPDGITWDKQRDITGSNVLGIAFGNSLFVAVGDDPTNVYTSNDAKGAWATQDFTGGVAGAGSTLHGITWSATDSQFVAVGEPSPLSGVAIITTSPNGKRWTLNSNVTDNPNSLYSVTSGNGLYVAVGNPGSGPSSTTVYVSTTGKNKWKEAQNPPCGCQDLNGVTFAGGQYVAVGGTGRVVNSPDGQTWTLRTPSNGLKVFATAYDSGFYVAAGESGFVDYSSDGASWQPALLKSGGFTDNLFLGFNINGLAIANGKLVMVGDNGAAFRLNTADLPLLKIAQLSAGVGNSGTSNTLTAVTFGGGQFVAVGFSGTIINSNAGLNYNLAARAGTNKNLFGVTFGNSLYVAVGAQGTIVNSPNANRWTAAPTTGTTNPLRAVAFGNGRFVAVGDNATIVTSTDGNTWTLVDPGLGGKTPNLNGVAFGSGRFVATGNKGTIVTSPDGLNWSADTSGTKVNLYTVLFGSNNFVTGGDSETILTSP